MVKYGTQLLVAYQVKKSMIIKAGFLLSPVSSLSFVTGPEKAGSELDSLSLRQQRR